MAAPALLTDRWLVACNEALAELDPVETGTEIVLTQHVTDAPSARHPEVTLIADGDGVRLVAGPDPRATAWLTLSLADAESLHDGTLSPATALSQGRVRVRGDLRAVIDGVALLSRAHAAMRTRR